MIMDLLENPYFLIPVISFFVAQLIKFGIRVWRNEPHDRRSGIMKFFGTGNMPSSHTALVVALVMTVAFESGLDSAELGISFAFAAIVIYDALNVRRAVGEQSGVLQHLIDRAKVPKQEREKFNLGKVLGHRPIEVLAGGLLAVVITMIIEYDKWWDWYFNGLQDISDTDINIFYGMSVAAIIIGLATVVVFRRKHLKKLPTGKSIIRSVSRSLIIPGLIGLVLTWLLQEGVSRFDSAFWLFLVFVWGVTMFIISWFKVFHGAMDRLREEQEHFSEEKKRSRQRRKSKKRR